MFIRNTEELSLAIISILAIPLLYGIYGENNGRFSSYSGSIATDSFSCGKDKNDGKKTHNCLNLWRNKELVITKQNINFTAK